MTQRLKIRMSVHCLLRDPWRVPQVQRTLLLLFYGTNGCELCTRVDIFKCFVRIGYSHTDILMSIAMFFSVCNDQLHLGLYYLDPVSKCVKLDIT